MENCENKPVGPWDDYVDNWLSVEDVNSVTDYYEVTGVEEVEYKEGKRIKLILRFDDKTFLFSLNKSNNTFLINAGIKHPADIVGERLGFTKTKVFNPTLKKQTDALRIAKIVGIATNEKVEG